MADRLDGLLQGLSAAGDGGPFPEGLEGLEARVWMRLDHDAALARARRRSLASQAAVAAGCLALGFSCRAIGVGLAPSQPPAAIPTRTAAIMLDRSAAGSGDFLAVR